MSSGQEATCDCANCVGHRGGTWQEVYDKAHPKAPATREDVLVLLGRVAAALEQGQLRRDVIEMARRGWR